MLAAGHTAHGLVELRAAVAACDCDGSPPGLAQGVEHVLDQELEAGCRFGSGGVVDAQAGGSARAGELVECEILHDLCVLMI